MSTSDSQISAWCHCGVAATFFIRPMPDAGTEAQPRYMMPSWACCDAHLIEAYRGMQEKLPGIRSLMVTDLRPSA